MRYVRKVQTGKNTWTTVDYSSWQEAYAHDVRNGMNASRSTCSSQSELLVKAEGFVRGHWLALRNLWRDIRNAIRRLSR